MQFDEVVASQYSEELSFEYFTFDDLKQLEISLKDFSLTDKDNGTLFIFDKKNKAVWQTKTLNFETVVEGLKKTGFKKSINKPKVEIEKEKKDNSGCGPSG